MKLNRTLGLLLVATATVGAGAAVAAAATTSPAAAPAATATSARSGGHRHHHDGGMLVGVTLRAARQLNLTAGQQTAIKGILSDAQARRQAAGDTPFIDIVTLGNPGDPNYATALQNAKTAAANRLQSQVEVQTRIYNVLTAEQKARLPQVLTDMKTKAQQRRAASQQQHEAAEAGAAGSN